MIESTEKVLEKIKKCLALAKSSNPNEANTALRQARKLMDMHNIELHDVKASMVSQSSRPVSKKPPSWALKLGQVCSDAFGCALVAVERFDGTHFRFIGANTAPELSSYAFEVLARQLKKSRTEHVATLKRCKLSTKRRRGDEFADAWVNAVYSLVSDFAGIDEEVAEQISEFKKQHYPNLVSQPIKPRKQNARFSDSRAAGYLSGKSARLHQAMGADQRTAISHRGA